MIVRVSKLNNYYKILKSQMVELTSLGKLHDRNVKDFEEIKGIGTSEAEPRGVDLLGNVPGCVCQKVREMGPFST